MTPKPPWRGRKEAHLASLRTASESVRLVVTADKLDNAELPVPENATRIQGLAGQWYDDTQPGTIFGVDSTTKGAVWTADALDASPTTDQLQTSVVGSSPDLESLRSTSNVPASLGELVGIVVNPRQR